MISICFLVGLALPQPTVKLRQIPDSKPHLALIWVWKMPRQVGALLWSLK